MQKLIYITAAWLYCSNILIGQDSLVPTRDWTSADGKVISAELVEFSRGVGQFRTREGRRFAIEDKKFSMLDQAVIFKARMLSEFEKSESKDINTEFFYSKHIPANRRATTLSGTIAFGPNRFNLGIYIPRTEIDFRTYEEIIVKNSTGSFTYPIGKNDVTISGQGDDLKSRIRMYLRHKRDEGIIPVIEKGLKTNTLEFIVKGPDGEKTFRLSDSEKNSLRDYMPVFAQASALFKAGFLKVDRLSDQTSFAKTDKPGETKKPANDLERFRKQLSKKKYGEFTWTPEGAPSEKVDGLGYLGTDIVVRTARGDVKRIPFTEVDKEGLQRIYEMRLEDAFGEPTVVDGGNRRYYHKEWEDNKKIYVQTLFFSILADGRGFLVLNAWTSAFGGKPMTEVFVRGKEQDVPVIVPCKPIESKIREGSGRKYTTTFVYLDPNETRAMKTLSEAEFVALRMKSGEQSTSAHMKEDELHVTRESIAVHQWFKALN